MRVALLIALLATVVYANSIGGQFVSDDHALILEHPFTKHVADWPRIFTAGHYAGGGGYRPITTLSFAINDSLGGENPVGYHLVNIALHALNSALIFLLLRRLFRSDASAIVAALLFAVHPVHTEAVAWISGRAELLACAFFLLAWIGHVSAENRLTSSWRIISWLAFVLATLSKENALVLPIALFFGDVVERKPVRYHSLGVYASYVALLVVPAALRSGLYHRPLLRAVSQIQFIDNPLAHVPLLSRVLTALAVQAHYFRVLVWPAKLCADYSFDTIPVVTQFASSRSLVSLALVLIALAVLAVSLVRRNRAWFGIALYIVTILPVANLITPIGTIAGERLPYLPSLGFCAVVALAWNVRLSRLLMIVVLALVLAAAGTRTWLRNRIWQNEDALWSSVVQIAPRNFKAQLLLGGDRLRTGRVAEAIAALSIAHQVYPESEDAAVTLAAALLQGGRFNEAIALCRNAIAQHPERAAIHINLGLAYCSLGNFAAGIGELQRASELDPQNAVVRLNLGLALSRSGDLDRAIGAYREATQLKPDYAEAWNALGAALLTKGERNEARQAIETALRLRSNFPEAADNMKLLGQP